MKPNMGMVDRIVRVIAGLIILGVGLHYRSWWGLLGLVPILTAVIAVCPGYIPFGIRTNKPKPNEPPIPPGGPKAA